MKLNNKVYDVMKWIVMIVLPALSAFYVALAPVWGWPYAEQADHLRRDGPAGRPAGPQHGEV